MLFERKMKRISIAGNIKLSIPLRKWYESNSQMVQWSNSVLKVCIGSLILFPLFPLLSLQVLIDFMPLVSFCTP